jgi:hypothetical protein
MIALFKLVLGLVRYSFSRDAELGRSQSDAATTTRTFL